VSKCVKRMMLDSFEGIVRHRPDFIVIDASQVGGVAINRLRLDFSTIQINILGVKNAIACKVLGDIGVSGLDRIFSGPSAIVFGGADVVELCKRVVQHAELNKNIVIRGGVVDGCVIAGTEISAISHSPGRLELLSSVASLLLSPGGRIVSSVKSVGNKIANQIDSVGV
jgi:large subunit ribosomal protein L10